MVKTYLIKRLKNSTIEKMGFWYDIPSANIDCYPWNNLNNLPKAKAKMVYCDHSFHVLLRASERGIKATYKKANDFVHKDSCLEFFFNPNPAENSRYFNFEFNPFGTIYFSIGSSRHTRILLKAKESKKLRIQSLIESSDSWFVKFEIPFSFIEKYYGYVNFNKGKVMKGNFYKCGDETELPHYGSWNPISYDVPDFHRSEFFGNLILD